MACEVCEHCQVPLSREEGVAIHDGYSYHMKCNKCYVCSETNLHNAEVFKGVIFCSSCSQRIFQSCFTARRTKNNRQRRSPTRNNRRRDRVRVQERKIDANRTGVIELAGLAASTDSTSRSNSDDTRKDKSSKTLALSTELALQVGKQIHDQKSLKKDSTEIGMTTEVTQELLQQINCPVITGCKYKPHIPPRRRPRYKGDEHVNNMICSDLRIAELGASTEIANMALRKKSELPVIIKSDLRLKPMASLTLSILNQESDLSGDGQEWLDSEHSTTNDFAKTHWMDRRIGSLMKLPYKSFKKNILERSSLVSVLMSSDADKFSLLNKLKQLFYEEITEHHSRGLQRLYPTINRKKVPYRLGWLDLVTKVSQVMRCKHYRRSHSYRCMRSHVMRLAGPTKSELAGFRKKVKRYIAPSFLRRILAYNSSRKLRHTEPFGDVQILHRNQRAITTSQACGNQ